MLLFFCHFGQSDWESFVSGCFLFPLDRAGQIGKAPAHSVSVSRRIDKIEFDNQHTRRDASDTLNLDRFLHWY